MRQGEDGAFGRRNRPPRFRGIVHRPAFPTHEHRVSAYP